MNKFTYKSKYGEYKHCQFMLGHYINGNIGIEIWDDEVGPICKVTVNPDVKIPNDRIAIKNYEENEGMVEWLKSMEIIEPDPTNIIRSGFVEIPVHLLTDKGKEMLGLE